MKRTRWVLLIAALAAMGITGCAGMYGYGEYHGTSSEGYGRAYDYGDDYDALAPYGTWVQVSYGWAWCPMDVSAGWRPYTVGYWTYTDWGWMWMSQDPWGSVPYHYGRWAYDDFYGYVWIPGDVWAPAWVSWRYGADWVGWAPLPPEYTWEIGVGFQYSSFDDRIDRGSWCFVPTNGFMDRRLSARVAPPSRNATLIARTENVTRFENRGSMPAVRGPDPGVISRATGRSVPQYRIVDESSPRFRGHPVVRGRDVEVFRSAPQGDQGRGRAQRDDRVRTEPPVNVREAPSPRLVERQRMEGQRMSQQLRTERDELRRAQARERRQPPPGVSSEALEQRHQAEQQAQDEREQRMRAIYEHRQEKFGGQGNRGRGRGRGRDQGDDNSNNSSDQDRDNNRGRGRDR